MSDAREQARRARAEFARRYPGVDRARHADPFAEMAFQKIAVQNLAPDAVFAECLEAMAERHAEVMKAYLDLYAKMPPPDITGPDGAVHRYVGPCAACGREGPR